MTFGVDRSSGISSGEDVPDALDTDDVLLWVEDELLIDDSFFTGFNVEEELVALVLLRVPLLSPMVDSILDETGWLFSCWLHCFCHCFLGLCWINVDDVDLLLMWLEAAVEAFPIDDVVVVLGLVKVEVEQVDDDDEYEDDEDDEDKEDVELVATVQLTVLGTDVRLRYVDGGGLGPLLRASDIIRSIVFWSKYGAAMERKMKPDTNRHKKDQLMQ